MSGKRARSHTCNPFDFIDELTKRFSNIRSYRINEPNDLGIAEWLSRSNQNITVTLPALQSHVQVPAKSLISSEQENTSLILELLVCDITQRFRKILSHCSLDPFFSTIQRFTVPAGVTELAFSKNRFTSLSRLQVYASNFSEPTLIHFSGLPRLTNLCVIDRNEVLHANKHTFFVERFLPLLPSLVNLEYHVWNFKQHMPLDLWNKFNSTLVTLADFKSLSLNLYFPSTFEEYPRCPYVENISLLWATPWEFSSYRIFFSRNLRSLFVPTLLPQQFIALCSCASELPNLRVVDSPLSVWNNFFFMIGQPLDEATICFPSLEILHMCALTHEWDATEKTYVDLCTLWKNRIRYLFSSTCAVLLSPDLGTFHRLPKDADIVAHQEHLSAKEREGFEEHPNFWQWYSPHTQPRAIVYT